MSCSLYSMFLFAACTLGLGQLKGQGPTENIPYPETKRTDVQDTLHGVVIADPYRWLEDDHSEDTKDWVRRQNLYTRAYLDAIPFREEVASQVGALLNTPRLSSPAIHGEYLYYHRNSGSLNQSRFYRKPLHGGEEELVLDPNTFSVEGTSSLGSYSFSRDHKYLAYQISVAGADWKTIHVMDLHTLKNTGDIVSNVKFSDISWAEDGFYYSRYPAGDSQGVLTRRAEHHSLYYHALHTNQAEDILVYRDEEDPLRNVYGVTSRDEEWLILSVVKGTSGNRVLVRNLKQGKGWITVNDSFETDYNFLGNAGDTLYFYTNDGAPNYRIVSFVLKGEIAGSPHIVVGEKNDALTNVRWYRCRFFCHYLVDASSQVEVFSSRGEKIGRVEMPGIGTFSALNLSEDNDTGFFRFSSFIRPATIYRLDASTLDFQVYSTPEAPFNSNHFITIQKKFKSYDGTKVPLFISYRKDLNLKDKHPTLLYGYGGFNIPITPGFSAERAAFMEMGGVYAVANIRGGGEYGEEWHRAGTLAQKQNVFNDFQAAAEYLLAEGWAQPGYLAIEGRSNGGLLAGACLTQRPDLYKVVFPIVGVLDMLRYHLFTIGWAWASDYGKSTDPRAFAYLRRYSPLHNLHPAAYPATMVMTADHDDRVVPAHSFKFAAMLQHVQLGDAPTLIRIDHNAGHGSGKSLTLREAEMVDKLSFLWYEMNLTPEVKRE